MGTETWLSLHAQVVTDAQSIFLSWGRREMCSRLAFCLPVATFRESILSKFCPLPAPWWGVYVRTENRRDFLLWQNTHGIKTHYFNSFKVYSSLMFSTFILCTITTVQPQDFSSLQTETPCPLSGHSLSPAPSNHQPASCLCGCGCFAYFIKIKSYNVCRFASGFFHIAQCFKVHP